MCTWPPSKRGARTLEDSVLENLGTFVRSLVISRITCMRAVREIVKEKKKKMPKVKRLGKEWRMRHKI